MKYRALWGFTWECAHCTLSAGIRWGAGQVDTGLGAKSGQGTGRCTSSARRWSWWPWERARLPGTVRTVGTMSARARALENTHKGQAEPVTDTESAWQAWEGKRQAEELRGHGRRALRARLPPGRRPCPRHPSTHPLIECRDNPRDHDICFLGMPRDSTPSSTGIKVLCGPILAELPTLAL